MAADAIMMPGPRAASRVRQLEGLGEEADGALRIPPIVTKARLTGRSII